MKIIIRIIVFVLISLKCFYRSLAYCNSHCSTFKYPSHGNNGSVQQVQTAIKWEYVHFAKRYGHGFYANDNEHNM